MHVFIIETKEFREETAKSYGEQIITYDISSVSDARAFQKTLTFTPRVKTVYVLNGLSDAGEIAQTTLLKTLEEGSGTNAIFLIPTEDRGKLLATIQSRAQLIQDIKLKSNASTKVDLSIHSLMETISNITNRDDAVAFIQNILLSDKTSFDIKIQGLITLQALKANGNVTIQLLNFVMSIQ